jgi:23S rRNA (guanine2445-N2)-methyltransferase / 23S rRNA (guanine2069-N7)-methyltransferase
MNYAVFVSCPKGFEYLLEQELHTLGLSITRVSPQGVYGEATLAKIYHLCLWSRLANRLQVILLQGEVLNQKAIYQLCYDFSWSTVFSPDKTLCIEFHGLSDDIRNSMFGAQLVKDAIVDNMRAAHGARPVIDRDNPQIRLHAHLKNDQLTVSFDVTGFSMHQRGYRLQAGVAPLKENIAAGMLIRAGWPEYAAMGSALHDPFCGSGTLVIEASMIAKNMAPGLLRSDQSLQYWAAHQPLLWAEVREAALQAIKPYPVILRGSDCDPQVIALAKANAQRAGVADGVDFSSIPLEACRALDDKGLLIGNPPYGERLGDVSQLVPLYQQLGEVLHANYQGWDAAILTSDAVLAKSIGLRAHKQYAMYNGGIECKLYLLALNAANEWRLFEPGRLLGGTQMFVNRLQKNYKHLKKWASRNQISCYRLYDADLPEYAFAIDLYRDYVVLQEYTPPSSVDVHKSEKRRLDVMQVVPQVLGIPADQLIMKTRQTQKGLNQYQKMNQVGRTLEVSEGRAKLMLNLYDYLDTGLFLDHRPLRLLFSQLPKETRFLNCFCYTASASIHAALNGAVTTNVDLSNTYLRWAQDNFHLNQIDVTRHQFIQYDCLEWLEVSVDKFDVIFLDPPSFSNSKRMTTTFDIQRDQDRLIQAAMRRLAPNGTLYFSTNLRHFKLSALIQAQYGVQDISAETIDVDFKRNSRIHQCFIIKDSA